MATRQRPGDAGRSDARRLASTLGRDLRVTRRATGLSIEAAAVRAGMSPSQLGRLERAMVGAPSLESFCRASRAIGLEVSIKVYPSGPPVRDRAQQALLRRFEAVLAPPLTMVREVPLPLPGDLRAWDARISDGQRTASVEGESRIEDAQALERRIALKERDDPASGVVLLVVNRTAHNLDVLAGCREALRVRFPLDGAAVLASLRRGRVPPAGGIVLL